MQGNGHPATMVGVLQVGMEPFWATTCQPSLPSARTSSRPVILGSGATRPTVAFAGDILRRPSAHLARRRERGSAGQEWRSRAGSSRPACTPSWRQARTAGLAQLKARSAQLRARRDEVAVQVAAVPAAPSAAALRQVADHIGDIVESGSHGQRKALIEVLIAQIKIIAPGRIVPVFRIPQPASHQPEPSAGPATAHCGAGEDPVRAMTTLVGRQGLEP
jgi:hypothetical protein